MEDDKGCSLSPFTATLDRGRVAMDVNNGAATWIREIVDTQQRGNKDGGGFSLSLLPLSLPLSHVFHDRERGRLTKIEDRSWPQGSDHDKDGPFRKLLSSLLSKRATSSTRNPRYHEVKCHLKKLALSARERKIHEIRLLYATNQFLGTCICIIVALGNSFTFQNFFSLFVNLRILIFR